LDRDGGPHHHHRRDPVQDDDDDDDGYSVTIDDHFGFQLFPLTIETWWQLPVSFC
jgi:hypothetical protein